MASGARRTSTDLGIGTGLGAFSGAFGVGGGILLVPFLVLVRRVPQKQAQATSLVMVAMAAAAGAVRYAFSEEVAWLPALVITIGGLAGAWLGVILVQRSPNALLQGLFGLMLMTAGIRMLWPTTNSVASHEAVASGLKWRCVSGTFSVASVAADFVQRSMQPELPIGGGRHRGA